MGQATIAITMDRYGHLTPGNEQEAAGLLDAYNARLDVVGRPNIAVGVRRMAVTALTAGAAFIEMDSFKT